MKFLQPYRMGALIFAAGLFIIETKFFSQDQQELTQAQFETTAEKVLGNLGEKELFALVRENKYRVAPLVYKLLNRYLKAELDHRNEEASKHISDALQLARIFARIFEDDRYLIEARQWQGWPRGKKEKRIYADSLRDVGWVLRYKARYKEALECFENALLTYTKITDRRGESEALNRIGVIHGAIRDNSRALAFFQRSLQLSQEIGYDKAIWINLNSIGNLHQREGELNEAKSYYEQAFEIIKLVGEKRDFLVGYGSLGLINQLLGNYRKSLSYYLQSAKISREIGNKRTERITFTNLGNLYFELGDYNEALDYYQRTLQAAREDSNKFGETAGLINIGTIYHREGNHKKAEANFKQALAISRQIDDKMIEEQALINLGVTYNSQKKFKDALRSYEEALAIQKAINDKIMMAATIGNLASLYSRFEDYTRATRFYKQALIIAQETNSPYETWYAQKNFGTFLKNQGNWEEAFEYLSQAIETVESIRAKVGTDSYKASFMEEKISIYESLIDLLISMGKCEEAFHYSERAKARALLDILSLGQIDITEGISPERLEKKKQIEQKYNGIYGELANERMKDKNEQNRDRINALNDSLKFVKVEYETLVQDIRTNHPKFAELAGLTKPLTLKQVQEQILNSSIESSRPETPAQPVNHKLIEYFVGEDQTIVWIVAKDTMHCEMIKAPRDSLYALMQAISPSLFAQKQKTAVGRDTLYITQAIRDHGWANVQGERLYDFYKTIFQRVEKHLQPGDELTIIPDGILFYFPFEMLISEKSAGKSRYLIEKYPISYVSSASLLNPELFKIQLSTEKDLIAFGNPDFGGKQDSDLRKFVQSLLPKTWQSVFRGDSLKQLPYSGIEVEEIAKNFKNPAIYTGKEASEDTFKKNVANHRFLHVSTHSIVNEVQPMYSQILLAQPKASESDSIKPEEDGILHTYEVLSLHLNAEMVVLSACNTGLGKFSRGEGFIGMSRAFMYAGAPSLVVSQWVVEDRSTSQLMRSFYRYLKDGMNKRQALRQAKLDLIASGGKEANPFYWAPFILIGDWAEVEFEKAEAINLLLLFVLTGLAILIFFYYAMRKKPKLQE